MSGARRACLAWGSVALGGIALAAVAGDAAQRRQASARGEPAVRAVAARLPSADLALSGGARWLRAPSTEEPSAAFDLGPAMLDPDPAGGLVSPPREVWAEEAARGGAPR